MSAWVVGVAIGAAYLITNGLKGDPQLELQKDTYNSSVKPSTDGVTSAEVRKAWTDTRFVQFGDMHADLATAEKAKLARQVQAQQSVAQAFDSGMNPPEIQGVLMTFDRLGV